MQRQNPGIVALAGDNREDAAVRIGRVVSIPVRAGGNVRLFVRMRLNTRPILSVCKGISVRAEIHSVNKKGVLSYHGLCLRYRKTSP